MIIEVPPISYPSESILSYVSVADADIYMTYHLKKRFWASKTLDEKFAALQSACQRINLLNFKGQRVNPSMAFPRVGQSEVPATIKEAQIELALALLDGIDPEQELLQATKDSETYGNLKEVKNPRNTPAHISAGIPSMDAWMRLVPFLNNANSLTLDT